MLVSKKIFFDNKFCDCLQKKRFRQRNLRLSVENSVENVENYGIGAKPEESFRNLRRLCENTHRI